MRLDPPSTPLGMLQRGRGAGALWALAAPPDEARALLRRCILEDPRRDRQLDDTSEYLADLAEAVGLDLAPLDAHMEGPGRDPDPARAQEAVGLAGSVLVHLSARGGALAAEANRILRGVMAQGSTWADILPGWVFAATEAPPALAALEGVAGILSARFPDDDDLARAMDDPCLWPEWFVEGPLAHPRLAAAVSLPRTDRLQKPPDPMLETGLDDVGPEELRRASLGEPDLLRRARAVILLAERGEFDIEAIASILEQDLSRSRLSYIRQPLHRALRLVPAPLALPFARRWWDASGEHRRFLAETFLDRFAEPRDLPILAAVVSARADGLPRDEDCPCWVLEPFTRLGRAEARPLLLRTFEGTTCWNARFRALQGLVETPGGLPGDLAFECLWDGSRSIVEAGVARVDLDRPGARERLETLAATGSVGVPAAAAKRLEGDPPG
jgi:hypothetical protein